MSEKTYQVEVRYSVIRTVTVEAKNEREARKAAKDPENWYGMGGHDPLVEQFETARVMNLMEA